MVKSSKIEPAEAVWSRTFHLLWTGIAADPRLKRLPALPTLVLSDALDVHQLAQISGDKTPEIQVSRDFILVLRSDLQTHEQALRDLARGPALGARRGQEVARAVEELLIAFVILHELFHFLGGHLAWLRRPNSRPSFEFNESNLGVLSYGESSAKRWHRIPYRTLAQAYMLESEADCTALQWMTQSAHLPAVASLFGRKAIEIGDLRGRERRTAFRLVLTALWLALRRMEASRIELMNRAANTHPLPEARLFTAIGTLLQEFAQISGLRFDSLGGGHYTPNRRDQAAMGVFFKQVLKPVIQADWTPGEELLQPASLEAAMVKLLLDYANYMFDRPMETEAGRTVVRMERVRRTVYKHLTQYRYFPVIELTPPKSENRKDASIRVRR